MSCRYFFEKKIRDEIHKLYTSMNEKMNDVSKLYDQLFRKKTPDYCHCQEGP